MLKINKNAFLYLFLVGLICLLPNNAFSMKGAGPNGGSPVLDTFFLGDYSGKTSPAGFSCSAFPEKKPLDVLLFIGTSSSGKTTLAKEVLKDLPDFCYMGIDQFSTDLFDSFEDTAKTLRKTFRNKNRAKEDLTQEEELAKKELTLAAGDNIDNYVLYHELKKVLKAGNRIIADTVFLEEDHLRLFLGLLSGYNIKVILVYASLTELMERVANRNNGLVEEDKRSPFQVFDQYTKVYDLQSPEKAGGSKGSSSLQGSFHFGRLTPVEFQQALSHIENDRDRWRVSGHLTLEQNCAVMPKLPHDMAVCTTKDNLGAVAKFLADQVMGNFENFKQEALDQALGSYGALDAEPLVSVVGN